MCDYLNCFMVLSAITLVIANVRVNQKKDSVPPFTERIDTFEAEDSFQLFYSQMSLIYGLDQ